MEFSSALKQVLHEYTIESSKGFAGNPLAKLIRQELPKYPRNFIGKSDRFIIQGSPGQGNWAQIPWLGVFDRLVTESARTGFYVVYLIREDVSGIYLSLNQGVTTVRETYGSEAKYALRVRAADFLAQLGTIDPRFGTGPIDLKASSSSGLGAFYQEGSICSIYYPTDRIPSDDTLRKDLIETIDLYIILTSKSLSHEDSPSPEDDEMDSSAEDLSLLRVHKRYERNRKLARDAKRALGYNCKICGFNFEDTYGGIGKEFIEAHHLVPLSELRGRKVKLNPKEDFEVLCSNCHRMLHRTKLVGDIDGFRRKHLKK